MSKAPKSSSATNLEAAPAKAKKARAETSAPKAKKAAKKDSPVEPERDVVAEQAEAAAVAKPAAGKSKASAEAPVRGGDPALEKRLSEMTDFQLRAYQESTARISRDVKHAKSAAAKSTLALIEKEMARRVASPGSAPSGVRVGVASPKTGQKRD